MSTTIKDGGPAFPNLSDQSQSGWPESGLSLRDYFAAKAMQGMLANPHQDYAPLTVKAQAAVVESAYGIADAMLKARST